MSSITPLFPAYVLWIWFGLTALSVAYVAWDVFTRTPEMKVMKWGWVLVTLYTGPVGLLIYWFSCREPAPDTHETFIAPVWKQAVGSSIHCAAGDGTGIIVAAGITGFFGLRMGVDIWVEYAAGFALGLLIFQALFLKDMMGIGYWAAVRKTFLPEWMSMNAMMAGMLPVMVILMTRDMRAMQATSPWFWAYMSVAVLVGIVLSYPINYWLVKNKLKHGMGTERVFGKGGTPIEAAAVPRTTKTAVATPVPAEPSMAGMVMAGVNKGSMDHKTMDHKTMPRNAEPAAGTAMAGMDMSAGPTVSVVRKAVITLLTLLMLAGGYWLAAHYGDLSMRPDDRMNAMPVMDMTR